MKLGLIGYGRMGKMVEKIALDRNHEITSIIDLNYKEIITGDVDCYIDFSIPEALELNLPVLCEIGVPVVIGTTGWQQKKETFEQLFAESKNTGVWSSNFSLGVNLFWKIIEQAVSKMNHFANEYDIFIHEFHHKDKIDAPSGTALKMADIVLKGSSSKDALITDAIQRKIKPDELHVSSTRGGAVPGTHSLFFDSIFDTIEIKHTARTREGFALGAVLAAENTQKLDSGLFEFSQTFEKIFQ